MNKALAAILAWTILLALPRVPSPARAEEAVEIQRYLAHLYLGDGRDELERLYPPLRDWPSYVEPKGRVLRIKLQRSSAKHFPEDVDVMWVGMRGDNVVEIQLIYTADYTGEMPPDALVKELSLIYGEPKQSDSGKYYWSDGSRVMRVFYAQVPVLRGKERVVEMRTSLQLISASLVHRKGD